jgi:hypothetical protein
MDFEPYFKSAEKNRSTDHLKDLFFENLAHAQRGAAIINSTCFYLWITVQVIVEISPELTLIHFPADC